MGFEGGEGKAVDGVDFGVADVFGSYTFLEFVADLGVEGHEDRCELIGKKEVADRFCAKSNIWKRRTFLVETINQLRAAELLAMV